MSLQALDTIAQAEERARQIRAQAAAEAKKSVREAEDSAAAAIDAAGKKADAEVAEKIRAAEVKAEADARETTAATHQRQAEMRGRADRKMDQVVAQIVERIVNG